MPIYEYECKHCHHLFDLMQKVSDAPITICPNCNHKTVARLVSASRFQLKGTGWYETDFKKDTKKSSQTPTEAKESSSEKQPEASSGGEKE